MECAIDRFPPGVLFVFVWSRSAQTMCSVGIAVKRTTEQIAINESSAIE